MVESVEIIVIKKDGSKELFDRTKLLSGLLKACQKRPVKAEDIVADIENELHNAMKNEITTKALGEMVMDKLREIDEVSYVRFASVYREFKDVETFMNALRGLRGKKPRKK
jgi:transcriptional repressor NrdR